jgi:hypothetical protein
MEGFNDYEEKEGKKLEQSFGVGFRDSSDDFDAVDLNSSFFTRLSPHESNIDIDEESIIPLPTEEISIDQETADLISEYNSIIEKLEEKLRSLTQEERSDFYSKQNDFALFLKRIFPPGEGAFNIKEVALFHKISGSTPNLEKCTRLDLEGEYSIREFYKSELDLDI